MLVATIQIKMLDNRVRTDVLVHDDNETINAKNPQFSLAGTEKGFKDFVNRLGELGAKVVLQEF